MPALSLIRRLVRNWQAPAVFCILATSGSLPAQDIPVPPPPAPSLGDFLTGLPISAIKQDYLQDPLLRASALKDPLTGKIDPNSPKAIAAKIKAEEIDAPNKIAAIRYLGTVDCVAHPEARDQLLEQILVKNQPIERVRYEAARALQVMLARGRKGHEPGSDVCSCQECEDEKHYEHCHDVLHAALKPPLLDALNNGLANHLQCLTEAELCTLPFKLPHMIIHNHPKCTLGDICAGGPFDVCKNGTPESRRQDYCGGCCNEDTMKILSEVINGRDERCCVLEPSLRVRREAQKALDLCPCVPGPVKTEPEQEKPKTEGEEKAPPAEEASKETPASPIKLPPAPPAEGNRRNRPGQTGEISMRVRPPLEGLRGYCIVALRDRQFVKASHEFSSIYENTRYLFSSAEAKHKFDASPQTYAPVAAGIDVVHMQQTGQKIPGSILREHAGQFYLFGTIENWDAFRNNPLAYNSSAPPAAKQFAYTAPKPVLRMRAGRARISPKFIPAPLQGDETATQQAMMPQAPQTPQSTASAPLQRAPEIQQTTGTAPQFEAGPQMLLPASDGFVDPMLSAPSANSEAASTNIQTTEATQTPAVDQPAEFSPITANDKSFDAPRSPVSAAPTTEVATDDWAADDHRTPAQVQQTGGPANLERTTATNASGEKLDDLSFDEPANKIETPASATPAVGQDDVAFDKPRPDEHRSQAPAQINTPVDDITFDKSPAGDKNSKSTAPEDKTLDIAFEEPRVNNTPQAAAPAATPVDPTATPDDGVTIDEPAARENNPTATAPAVGPVDVSFDQPRVGGSTSAPTTKSANPADDLGFEDPAEEPAGHTSLDASLDPTAGAVVNATLEAEQETAKLDRPVVHEQAAVTPQRDHQNAAEVERPAKQVDDAIVIDWTEPATPAEAKIVAYPAGSCIVSFKNGQVLPAHKEFSSTHKGQTYHFATAQAKEEFDLFPDSYAPAYCGIDPVILKKSNQARYGRHVIIYSGKMYFFTSPDTVRVFLESPDAFRE